MKVCSGNNDDTRHEEIVCIEEICPLCTAKMGILYKEEIIKDLKSDLDYYQDKCERGI